MLLNYYEASRAETKFQWAPTLGGECYLVESAEIVRDIAQFQWAPTLGGECYQLEELIAILQLHTFQWAPTLGGECYSEGGTASKTDTGSGFNGHPPLGVNATPQTR